MRLRNRRRKRLAALLADVLILDGLDVENYRDKGVLADLSDVAQETETVGQVVSAVNGDGSTLVIPARFTVPILMTTDTSALPGTLEELTSAVLEHDADLNTEWSRLTNEEEEDSEEAKKLSEEMSSSEPYEPYLVEGGNVFYANLLDVSAPSLIRDQVVQEDAVRSWLTALFDSLTTPVLLDHQTEDALAEQ